MTTRQWKDGLYAQVARIGKALSSPKRLELIELLGQGEKPVETLASEAMLGMKLASAHLRALREANLVSTRRAGKQVLYRLSGADVAALGVNLRQVAEQHLAELRAALSGLLATPQALSAEARLSFIERARRGEIIVIDVRPGSEFDSAHLPFAHSLPLAEIEARLAELPADREIVAYCRGPFCLMSDTAVALLKAHGYRARKINEGVNEWLAAGLPLEPGNTSLPGEMQT